MIGREKEQKELLRRYRGNQAEFIAVYGRRRVGKTCEMKILQQPGGVSQETYVSAESFDGTKSIQTSDKFY